MTASPASSKRTPSTTVRFNPHARCHTLLFCTLFCSSYLRAVTQRENLEADRVQPASTLPKPPTDTAEERHNGTYAPPSEANLLPDMGGGDVYYLTS